ncbi:MAG: DUF3047 domain-containing protein, partial [Spirochaetales bacterium]|nr:DUF3047 domain-containing protein [Spirochaetales bacterium]
MKLKRILRIVLLFTVSASAVPESFIDFDNMDGWREQPFLYVKEQSYYSAETIDGATVLAVRSEDGISALVSEELYSIMETPILEWRWRVDDFPEGADPRAEITDDFSLRVYIMFQYDKGTIPLGDRIKYGFVKLVYNEFPPKRVLG